MFRNIITIMEKCNPVAIGQLIQQELKSQRRSAAWLATQLQCNRTNVYKIFNRSSIDCELLLKISQALSTNFFNHYSRQVDEVSVR